MRKTLWIILVLVIIGAGIYYFSFSGSSGVDSQRLSCQDIVNQAQEAAKDKVCTQVVQDMQCDKDSSFTYKAKNGCEINYLEAAGWTEAN